jgi:hypothetical protein
MNIFKNYKYQSNSQIILFSMSFSFFLCFVFSSGRRVTCSFLVVGAMQYNSNLLVVVCTTTTNVDGRPLLAVDAMLVAVRC